MTGSLTVIYKITPALWYVIVTFSILFVAIDIKQHYIVFITIEFSPFYSILNDDSYLSFKKIIYYKQISFH